MVKIVGSFVVGGLWALNIHSLSPDWWWIFLVGSWLLAGWVTLKLKDEPVDNLNL